MTRTAIAFALVAFACSASSEPRKRDVPPPPPPIPADAPLAIDAPEVVTMDAPSPPPETPTSPRTTFPVVEIKSNPDGPGTRVTIGIGKAQGVSTTWKAYLVDMQGKAIKRGELTIVSVNERTTWATTKLDRSQLPRDVQANVAPN